LGQHRTIWQEHSAKDFASYESYKRAGILYVFPPFITARMGQKIGRRPQTQLCGDALGSKLVSPMLAGEPEGRQETSASCLRLSKNPAEDVRDRAAGGVCGGQKAHRAFNQQDFETFLNVSKSAQRGENTFSTR